MEKLNMLKNYSYLKNNIVNLCFIFISINLDAQRDCNYLFGYHDCHYDTTKACLQFMDFCKFNPTVSYLEFKNSKYYGFIKEVSSISNLEGNLLFFTNGMQIYDKNANVIFNGDSINPGEFRDNFQSYGYPTLQGTFFLPAPGEEEKYVYLLHTKAELSSDWQYNYSPSVYSTKIDVEAKKVIFKNKASQIGEFGMNNLSAVKHANGRDWWLIQAHFKKNRLSVFLLSQSGIRFHHFETSSIIFSNENGQALFSPDGSKYVRHHSNSLGFQEVLVFDFDRCIGKLINEKYWAFSDINFIGAAGAAISPNSKYLYLSTVYTLHQYDLTSNNIKESDIIIAYADTILNPIGTSFYTMQLAPNNKIYICEPRSSYFVSYIDKPNEKGIACGVIQKQLKLEVYNQANMSYFPNYSLGPSPGSICDSLITSTKTIKSNKIITIASSQLFIELPQNLIPAVLEVYSIEGKRISQYEITKPIEQFEVLPQMKQQIVIYNLANSNKIISQGKLNIIN